MQFKETLKKIESFPPFKKFKQDFPEAELCAGFFVIDFLGNDNKQSLDYNIGETVFSFDINDKGQIFMKEDKLLDIPNKPKLTKINPEAKIEIDELKGLVGIQALENGISAKMHKLIAVLQNHDDKQVWNLTCMLEGLIIIHVLIDSETGDIIKFERRSMMDLIRKKE